MKKVITIMSAEEVLGSLTPILRSDYMDLLLKIEKETEEKTLDEILSEYYDEFGIADIHRLTSKERGFLNIFTSENYYVSTFNDEYCKDEL